MPDTLDSPVTNNTAPPAVEAPVAAPAKAQAATAPGPNSAQAPATSPTPAQEFSQGKSAADILKSVRENKGKPLPPPATASPDKTEPAPATDVTPPATQQQQQEGQGKPAADQTAQATPPTQQQQEGAGAEDYKGKYEQLQQQLRQQEHERQRAQVQKLDAEQQQELGRLATTLQQQDNAYARKYTQVEQLKVSLAQARAEEDYQAVLELQQQLTDAEGEAWTLYNSKELTRQTGARLYQQYQSEYKNRAMAEHEEALNHSLQEFGYSVAELKAKVKDLDITDPYQVQRVLLTTERERHAAEKKALEGEIATLKAAAEKAVEDARATWDATSTARPPATTTATGTGKPPADWKTTSSSEIFARAKAARNAGR